MSGLSQVWACMPCMWQVATMRCHNRVYIRQRKNLERGSSVRPLVRWFEQLSAQAVHEFSQLGEFERQWFGRFIPVGSPIEGSSLVTGGEFVVCSLLRKFLDVVIPY